MNRYLIPIIFSLGVISCNKQELPDNVSDVKADETVTVYLSVDFDNEMSADIQTRASIENLGYPDIWCFAYDGNTLIDGYPAKQSGQNGELYSYTLPKLANGKFIFAIMPDGVQFHDYFSQYNVHTLQFSATDPYSNSNTVYCSSPIYIDTNTGDIPVQNVELRQVYYNYEILFSFTGFPENIQEYITDWSFYIDCIDDNRYYFNRNLNFESLDSVYLKEHDKEYLSYKVMFLPQNCDFSTTTSSPSAIYVVFNTTDLKIYSKYCQFNSLYKNKRMYISIDYSDITETEE